ncbi:ABC transporter permease [Elioraea sp.]|uniref:ABC transporter permease n=1 Tax=Elioraea sp. TaxID=2185103 RepID=UPI003F7141B2
MAPTSETALKALVPDHRPASVPRRTTLLARLLGDRAVLVALLVLAVPVGLTLLSLVVTLGSVTEMSAARRLMPPGSGLVFGADALGRDLLARVAEGGQTSLAIGVLVGVIAAAGGLVLGLIAGYLRLVDAVLMRVMDGLMAIPGILLAIAFMSIVGASIVNVVVALGLTSLPNVVRLVRAMVLSLREQPFVEAAIAAGNGTPRIIFRHLLPQTLGPLAVQATFICTSAIIAEAYLSFIGVGTPPEIPSWGNVIADGRTHFRLAPWIVLIPGAFVAATVLAINLIGDALRDALDPRGASQL